MKHLYRIFSWALICSLAITSCKKDDDGPATSNEVLVSASFITTVSKTDVQARISSLLPGGGTLVNSGVKAYKIVYRTPAPDGTEVQASGLILVPDGFSGNLTLLGFQHGTLWDYDAAPSLYKQAGYESYYMGTLAASLSKGYIVAMPDYIGYGSSASVFHPYIHRQTMGSSCLNMLRAARKFAADNQLSIKDSIKILGYSEGGYATMALHKTIDETASSEFKVAQSFPGAGPYDVLGNSKQVIQSTTTIQQKYMLGYVWVTLAYNKYYKINAANTTYFTTPNIPAAQALLDFNFNTALTVVGNNPSQVFSPSFITSISNGSNTAMINALQDNNIYDWKPTGKVVLLHSVNDSSVSIQNSRRADSAMRARGANVTLVELTGAHDGQGAMNYILNVLPYLL